MTSLPKMGWPQARAKARAAAGAYANPPVPQTPQGATGLDSKAGTLPDPGVDQTADPSQPVAPNPMFQPRNNLGTRWPMMASGGQVPQEMGPIKHSWSFSPGADPASYYATPAGVDQMADTSISATPASPPASAAAPSGAAGTQDPLKTMVDGGPVSGKQLDQANFLRNQKPAPAYGWLGGLASGLDTAFNRIVGGMDQKAEYEKQLAAQMAKAKQLDAQMAKAKFREQLDTAAALRQSPPAQSASPWDEYPAKVI